MYKYLCLEEMATVPSVPNVYKQPLTELQQITLWWNAPTSDGGSPITSYVLSNTSPSFSNNYDVRARSAFVTGLSSNTSYSFQIAASNAIGLGPFTSFNTVTTGLRPFPISTITALPSTNTLNTSVNWPFNSSNSSYNIQGHVISAVPFDISGLEVIGSTLKPSFNTPISTCFLQNLGPYSYKLYAQAANSIGYSQRTASTIIDNVPGSAYFIASAGPPPSNSGLIISGGSQITLGLSTAFTYEWFQNMTSLGTSTNPRVFSSATVSLTSQANSFGFSFVNIGSGNLRYRMTYRDESDGTITSDSLPIASSNVLSNWKHFAVVGAVDMGPPIVKRMSVYSDGAFIYSTTTNYGIMTLTQPQIGFALPMDYFSAYEGYITSFRFVKDAALYSGSTYIRPKPPLFNSPTGTTQFLFPFYSSDRLLSNASGTDLIATNVFSNVSFVKVFPGYVVPSPPAAGGSLSFTTSGANYSFLTVTSPVTITYQQDYTFEWYQRLDSITVGATPTVFSVSYSGSPTRYLSVWFTKPGANVEINVQYPINGGSFSTSFPITTKTMENNWVHVAIVTTNYLTDRLLTIYLDGTLLASTSVAQPVKWSVATTFTNFTIGNYSIQSLTRAFKGNITNFRFTNSQQVYTAAFTKPTPPLSALVNTNLLLLVTDNSSKYTDSSAYVRTVVGGGAISPTFSTAYPS
jgi:hypothetical protein